MYLGIDVGGTKTLVVALNNEGTIVESSKFPTPKKYENWVLELRHTIAHFKHQDFKAGAIAAPGYIDRKHGRVQSLPNLKSWGKNLPILHDAERIARCPMVLENDAKIGALSEATLLKHEFEKVLYVTVSTGVGYGLVNNLQIDPNIGDNGGNDLMLEYRGKYASWESFASGHAIVERYGKRAGDIDDDTTWTLICRDIAKGLMSLSAITLPEVIVIGGSVGTYFDRYGKILQAELATYHPAHIPKIRGAQDAERAVAYGCYYLAKQRFAHAAAA